MAQRTPLEDRFWARVVKTDGCWLWNGKRSTSYGKISSGGRGGKILWAHRVAYELLAGPIPAGHVLDHLCRTPSCVNPAHLEAVTQRENLLRGDTVPAKNVAKSECPQGHAYDASNTYYDSKGSRHCLTCRRVRDSMRSRAEQ